MRTPFAFRSRITARPTGPHPITIATVRLPTSPRRTACHATAIGSVSAATSGREPVRHGHHQGLLHEHLLGVGAGRVHGQADRVDPAAGAQQRERDDVGAGRNRPAGSPARTRRPRRRTRARRRSADRSARSGRSPSARSGRRARRSRGARGDPSRRSRIAGRAGAPGRRRASAPGARRPRAAAFVQVTALTRSARARRRSFTDAEYPTLAAAAPRPVRSDYGSGSNWDVGKPQERVSTSANDRHRGNGVAYLQDRAAADGDRPDLRRGHGGARHRNASTRSA